MRHVLPVALTLFAATAAHAEPTDANLAGTWALQYWVATSNEAPIIGSVKSVTWTSVLVTLEEQDDAWTQQHLVCGAVLRGGIVKSRIPPAYVKSVPPKSYPLSIGDDDGTASYHADTGIFTAGYDPTCGAIPESMDDPCAVDWDGDGQPGATIHAKIPMFSWVEVYVSQRNHVILDGRATSTDKIEGTIEMREMSTQVIGASNSMFARSPVSEVIAEDSGFRMTRLSTEGSCTEVLALPTK